jgi:CBS domain-containing protein
MEDPMTIEMLLKNNGRGVTTIKSATTVGDAIWSLRKAGAGALIVSDNGRDILGLVSGQDLIRALKSHGVGSLMPMTVADIMHSDVLTCRPGESLRRAMARMTARGVGHVAVVGNSGLRGVVSLADVIKGRLQWARAEIETVCGNGALTG